MIEVYSSETDEFLEKTNKNGSNNLNSAAATAANFTENHSSSPNKDNKHEENKNSASAIKTQDDEENRIDQAAASAIEASQKLNPVWKKKYTYNISLSIRVSIFFSWIYCHLFRVFLKNNKILLLSFFPSIITYYSNE